LCPLARPATDEPMIFRLIVAVPRPYLAT